MTLATLLSTVRWVIGYAALTGVTAHAEPISATVASADPVAHTLTLDDGRVVQVSTGDAAVGYAGKAIRAQLDPDATPPALYAIWPNDPAEREVERTVNRHLHEETVAAGRQAFRSVGDDIPDFALYDQSGMLTRKETFADKNIVVNFIFTRCQKPTMCPASTARMVRLQGMIDAAGLEDAHLVTITFDPEYDTPGTLQEYATQRGAHFDNFSLLTGDSQAVKDLMKQFGILTIREDGTINHTAAVVLVDGNGQVLYRKEGSFWEPEDFFARLQAREPN